MTGTIKLVRILLLMVIQHGGDDVSCKRSIYIVASLIVARLQIVSLDDTVLSCKSLVHFLQI